MVYSRKKINTKLEILQHALHLFLEEGYTTTYITTIAKDLNISTGNLTFHYPTKEHLLEELVKMLCDYHWIIMEDEVAEGRTSLLTYLLELTAMTSVCDENPIAKDLYASAYTHSMSLKAIRENDTRKAKVIFAEYCPDWTEEDYAMAENIVSGIEYATLMPENAKDIPLAKRIAGSLDAVMKVYDVPKEIRELKISKVLAMDYRKIGRLFLDGFSKYVESQNAKALEAAAEQLQKDK